MSVIKNRDCPGGKEFWDHVEKVAEQVKQWENNHSRWMTLETEQVKEFVDHVQKVAHEQEANPPTIEARRKNQPSCNQIQIVTNSLIELWLLGRRTPRECLEDAYWLGFQDANSQ